MSQIKIRIAGVSAEIVLGNYIPTDQTIVNNWEDFYHYNDLIHHSQLLADHVSYIEVFTDNVSVFKGKIPATNFLAQKSFSPALFNDSLYLRTECVENSVFEVEFSCSDFNKQKLTFHTQSYDSLFNVGNSFIAKMDYDNEELNLNWIEGKPIGNICLLCSCNNGYLIPFYDAIKKVQSKQ